MRIRVFINIMKILHLHLGFLHFCYNDFPPQVQRVQNSSSSYLKPLCIEVPRCFSFDKYISSNELKCESSNFKDRTIIIPRKRFLLIKTFRIVYTINVITSSSHKNYWLNHKFCKSRPYDKYLWNPSLFIT